VEFSARTEIKRAANFTKKQKAPQTDSDKRQPAYDCNLQKKTHNDFAYVKSNNNNHYTTIT